jgi:hypothetical protein
VVTVRRRSSAAGFTLIEVMVALLLTVIAVIGIVALYMIESRASGFSRHETEASVLAEDKMEVLRTITPPCQGAIPCAQLAGVDANITEEELAGSNGIYTRTWSITPNTGPTPDWWDYLVSVTWTEDGVPRSVSETSRY